MKLSSALTEEHGANQLNGGEEEDALISREKRHFFPVDDCDDYRRVRIGLGVALGVTGTASYNTQTIHFRK